ncbi:MAG: glycosyltransferase [Prevotellaceae bacterium]|nr:glycosyltransferase [Prevotellaceae bacterium]
MRILFVNTSDDVGGAAIAARRLMQALAATGQVEARMLVRRKRTDDPLVEAIPHGRRAQVKFALERLELFVRGGFSRKNLFQIDQARFGTDITRHPLYAWADIVHLHWVGQAMLSAADLERLVGGPKPIVWTLHDMWPFMGICHLAALTTCDRWKRDCGYCPLLPGKGKADDLSRRVFRRKRDIYARGHIHFVGCSDYLAAMAAESPLTDGHTVRSIPNPIDTDFFAPRDSGEARRRLGLPEGKRILLFVACRATDPAKGIHYLADALHLLSRRLPDLAQRLAVAIAGEDADEAAALFDVEAHAMGYVADPARMRDLYAAADLLVMPTLQDNLPNTIVEALATGTPCVGFHTGGLPQMIKTGLNGYLAAYRDAGDLGHGIAQTLFGTNYAEQCRTARRMAVENYGREVVAARYTALYRGILETDTNNKNT